MIFCIIFSYTLFVNIRLILCFLSFHFMNVVILVYINVLVILALHEQLDLCINLERFFNQQNLQMNRLYYLECNATVRYISSWQTGFSGQLLVSSLTSRPLTADLNDTAGWRIEVTFSGSLYRQIDVQVDRWIDG